MRIASVDDGSIASAPQAVLAEFQGLRNEVLQVIESGERIIGNLEAVGDAAKVGRDFEHARRDVAESSLSLVVLGAEGAGKSTLIRGLLGQELSPIEASTAGTVAPVFLVYGESPQPQFLVEFSQSGKPARSCTREEYFALIQQRTNPGNAEKVRRAIVSVNNPMLAGGLILVDMPGTGGVDDGIREEANQFIRTHASTVVGVAAQRSYGPLVDIARELSTRSKQVRFHAIVSNRPRDFFYQESVDDLLSDAQIAEKIVAARSDSHPRIVSAFNEKGLTELPKVDDIFIFSANTLFSRSGQIATTSHLAEIGRFEQYLAAYVRENGLGNAVRRAARRGNEVVARVKGLVALRQDLLQRVLGGDRGLLSIFQKSAEKALREIWVGKAIGKPRLATLSEQIWTKFAAELGDMRGASLRDVDGLIRRLEAASDNISASEIRDLVGVVRHASSERIHALNERFAALLREGAGQLIADANTTLRSALEPLPIFAGHGAVSVEITERDIVNQALGAVGGGSTRDSARLIGGAAGAAAGLGIASAGHTLILVPDPTFITQTIGLLIGGVAAWKAVDLAFTRLIGSERQVALKELKEMRDGLAREASGNQTALRNEIVTAINLASERADASLNARLRQVEALIIDPGSERSRIESEQAALGAAYGALDELERRLSTVRAAVRTAGGETAQDGRD